ncbi:SAM-dependent methyltransferase [Hypericibacter adhaerens]|uniref:SAM-dependent methyltransferase n=1 Tax=Hypericibacter adhaerens TaxID=2602016 RepID=A0A5J6N5H4_9PROT|nr:methyltransferase domain-containing protein [Hypericibacter adhaerens]QEX22186.1 SAM-dependent methyltransferase [Hypericibacter adhaerens]
MTVEAGVSGHYSHGALERAILAALQSSGKDPDRLTPADLAPVDEFHIGGRLATVEFTAQLGFKPGLRLLDIGCGIGGASRHVAEAYGCQVQGIDLTDEYVRVAAMLAKRVGLADKVAYRQASALDLPFDAASFDGAYMLHVGMNIADKGRLAAEVARVLKPGAVFGIYDVMREGKGDLTFPLPWASEPAYSFVDSADRYRTCLADAGFTVERERNRREFAIEFFRQMQERWAQGGLPPLGLHILMGESARQKIANIVTGLKAGLIAPVEIVSRKRA